MMFAAFLAQCAAGCFLAVAVSAIRQCGWRYLRLMAIVSVSIAAFAMVLLLRESVSSGETAQGPGVVALGAGILFGLVWLFVNAAQSENIRNTQRAWPAIAGIACLTAAIVFSIDADALLTAEKASAGLSQSVVMGINTLLGAVLLGTTTAAMLLGHRYLTDTDMPIAPLRRLTKLYLGVIVARIVWVAGASIPVWSSTFQPAESELYFWLALCVRVGVGMVVAAIFAWMIWDCVKRRATQSATALYYLSMLMVFIGELAGQFLMRTEQLAL